MPRPASSKIAKDPLTSRRDSLDFRDWIYPPALIPLPDYVLPRKSWIHLLDQGEEGACTGFGLAAVINYLLRARGATASERVSPRMLYEMAKRHDQWPGHSYDGSTARGAMKGWYKNGVCHEEFWPYDLDDPGEHSAEARTSALQYPLGSFYRILPKRSDLHAALNEVGVVFASAGTHDGWDEPADGLILYESRKENPPGHAFAIIGYTDEGFLIQNSWDKDWGGVEFEEVSYPGCAIWSYADFDENVWDLWVARMARPVESIEALRQSSEKRATFTSGSHPKHKPPPRDSIRDHFIHIDDGIFANQGDYWSTLPEAKRVIQKAVHSGDRHIVFYAHGGLNNVKSAASRVARWRPVFQANGIYEIHFIWETGLLEEIKDILLGKQEFVQQRAGGLSDWVDRWIERLTGPLGRGIWREMLSDAEIAFGGGSAGAAILHMLIDEMKRRPIRQRPRLHLAGHSAGSVLFGHLLQRWQQLPGAENFRFENLVLFAPAISHMEYERCIQPAVEQHVVENLHHLLLDDHTELDDNVGGIYRKSLLYLLARAYQERGVIVPIMGLQKFLPELRVGRAADRIHHYDTLEHPDKTASKSHGDFDNDPTTMETLLRLVLGKKPKRSFTADELEGH